MHSHENISPARFLHLFAVLLVSVLLPAGAMAGGGKAEYPLPDPKTTEIEIPGSLGGISLGQTRSEALQAWGHKAACGKSFCHWGKNHYAFKGEAGIGFAAGGVVDYVAIGWSPSFVDGKRPIRRSITKFHTPEGIRLKSTAKEVKKAYPKVKTVSPGHCLCYKFESDDATMYIHVGSRFVEEIEIRPPGFEYTGE